MFPRDPVRSQELFRQLMAHSPAAAYVKDAQGRFVWVNALLERTFGRELGDWLGRTAADLFPPEQAERVLANDREALQSGQTLQFVETVTVAGDTQHWLTYKFPITQADGAVFLGGMSVNITEQVRAREEVQRLHEELQALLDVAPAAIFRTEDPDCARITANRAGTQLLELPEGSNVSRSGGVAPGAYELRQDGRPLATDEMPLERAARGTRIQGAEYELVLAGGLRKHIYGYATPLFDAAQRPRGAVAAFLDVTEPVRARRRLEALFNTNLIGALTWRLDGTITSANDSFLRSVGYTREEFAAGRMSWRALTPQDYSALDDAKVAELLANRYHAPYEKEYLRRDGSRVPVLVYTAFFPDSPDEGISYIADLSSVKAAEQRIRELLAEVTAASQAKDDFLAMLAHELRNPLAPIRHAVEIFRARGTADPQLAWARDVIERQVSHMARMLEDLLDVSRISRNKLELRRQTVALADVLEAAVETSRPLIEGAGLQLAIVPPAPGCSVQADPVRLAQVFANLLNNAARYTPRGGHVELRAECVEGQAVVRVRDDGIGFAADQAPQLFQIFFQAERATTHAQGGLGIGLSLVKGIVELHGGSVAADSPGPGEGSVFTVRLPLAPPEADAAQAPQEDADSAPRHRVLVVDDNTDSADTLAALLELDGHEVRAAYHGRQALAAAGEFGPSVVLLDLGMPDIDGIEVCRRLRAEPGTRDALIVAMTGWGQAEDRRRTAEAGFDRHLVKPVDPAAVAALLAGHAPLA